MKKIFFAFAAMVFASVAFAQYGGYNGGYNGGYDQQQREMSAGQYGQNSALRASAETAEVEVLYVRNVMIQPKAGMGRQTMGTMIGGALGAAAGSAMGQSGSSGRTAATAILGLIGGAVGNVVAEPSAVPAQELTIRRVGGQRMITIVQAGSAMAPGQRALAVDIGGEIRVTPIGNDAIKQASTASGLSNF